MYLGCSEAKFSYLRKEQESKVMQKEDKMDVFLVYINDLNEQLIFVGEVILDNTLVETLLDTLPVDFSIDLETHFYSKSKWGQVDDLNITLLREA